MHVLFSQFVGLTCGYPSRHAVWHVRTVAKFSLQALLLCLRCSVGDLRKPDTAAVENRY